MPSCTAPSFLSAPLPRPFATAARASKRCDAEDVDAEIRAPRVAPSTNRPVPQNCEPSAKPHSHDPKARLERAQLEQADRASSCPPARRRSRCSCPASRSLLRPGDELLEAFDRGRRRRNEPRHLLGGEHRQQRRRILGTQLAKHEVRSREDRQARAPVGRRRPLTASPWSRHAPARAGTASFPLASPARQHCIAPHDVVNAVAPARLLPLAVAPDDVVAHVPQTMLSTPLACAQLPQTMLSSCCPTRCCPSSRA